MATRREAERAAQEAFPDWVILSVTEEGSRERGRKVWSFGAVQDAEDGGGDLERTGYVHADGSVEGLC